MAPLVDLGKYGYSLTFLGKIDFETNAGLSNGTAGKLAVHAEVSRHGNLNTNLVDFGCSIARTAFVGLYAQSVKYLTKPRGRLFNSWLVGLAAGRQGAGQTGGGARWMDRGARDIPWEGPTLHDRPGYPGEVRTS